MLATQIPFYAWLGPCGEKKEKRTNREPIEPIEPAPVPQQPQTTRVSRCSTAIYGYDVGNDLINNVSNDDRPPSPHLQDLKLTQLKWERQ